MRHNKDVIVPNVWRPLPDWLGGEQPCNIVFALQQLIIDDLNSWQESETALQLANDLDEDAVIVEGYAEYATWRPHLAYLRDPYGDPMEEMDLDGVGGVSILSKARVFRSGTLFPAFSYERHAETEVPTNPCVLRDFLADGLCFRALGNGHGEWDLKSLVSHIM
jgi:mannan polymerase II complex ANP1 subunit